MSSNPSSQPLPLVDPSGGDPLLSTPDALAIPPATLSSSHLNDGKDVDDDNKPTPQPSSTSATISNVDSGVQNKLARLPSESHQAFLAACRTNDKQQLEASIEQIKAETEQIKASIKEIRAETERAIEARKRAEALQARGTSLLENADVFDHIMLDDNGDAHDAYSLRGLQRNLVLPHTISPDKLMMERCPRVIQWISDIMADHRCVDLLRPVLTSFSKLIFKQDDKDQRRLESVSLLSTMGQILPSLLLALAHKMVQLEQAAQTRSDTSTQPQPWQRLNDALPNIPWKLMLTKGFILFTKPKDPFNEERIASKATSSQDTESDISFDDDDDDDDDTAAGNATSRNRQFSDPNTSRLVTDFAFSIKNSNREWVTFHLGEIGAYYLGELWELDRFFANDQHDSTASSANPWRTINVSELACDKRLDRQALSGVSQCMTYMSDHRVAFEVLTTGFTNVFFRIDHAQRLEQPDAPVNLLYHVVSGDPANNTSEVDESGERWKPDSLCLTFLYSVLRGLSAAFTTTDAERIEWGQNLSEALPTVEQLGLFGPTDCATQQKASTAASDRVPDGSQDDADLHDNDQDKTDRADGNRGCCNNESETNDSAQGQTVELGGDGADCDQGHVQQPRNDGFDVTANPNGSESRILAPFDTLSPALRTALPETATQEESEAKSGLGDSSMSSNRPLTKSVSITSSAFAETSTSVPDACRLPSSVGAPSFAPLESVSLPAPGQLATPYFSHSTEHEWDGSERYRGRSPRLITQQWCSNACLLGLKNGSAMDPACPNVELHCKLGKECQDHAKHGHFLSIKQLQTDLNAQLRYGAIVHIMEPIANGTSSRCQLFRISHPKFGYALAAKGTHALRAKHLRYEDWMYKELWKDAAEKGPPQSAESSASVRNGYPIIGITAPPESGQEGVALQIPISFGVITPAPEFCDVMYPLWPSKDHFEVANICNTFLLLSYHGHNLRHPKEYSLVRQRLPASLQYFGHVESWVGRVWRKAGVWHDDIAPRNLLWCRRLEALVMIDFESAQFLG